MGPMHPIAWYHDYDGGRSFYTALGHLPTDFSNDAFLNHLYAGILWAATGKK
ncbi:MAG: ThuA domain-containing protein [Chitinophagales bacterium]